MKQDFRDVLHELYKHDKSLKSKEKELLELFELFTKHKPSSELSSEFKDITKAKLKKEIAYLKEKKQDTGFSWKAVSLLLSGVVGAYLFLFSTLPYFNTQIETPVLKEVSEKGTMLESGSTEENILRGEEERKGDLEQHTVIISGTDGNSLGLEEVNGGTHIFVPSANLQADEKGTETNPQEIGKVDMRVSQSSEKIQGNIQEAASSIIQEKSFIFTKKIISVGSSAFGNIGEKKNVLATSFEMQVDNSPINEPYMDSDSSVLDGQNSEKSQASASEQDVMNPIIYGGVREEEIWYTYSGNFSLPGIVSVYKKSQNPSDFSTQDSGYTVTYKSNVLSFQINSSESGETQRIVGVQDDEIKKILKSFINKKSLNLASYGEPLFEMNGTYTSFVSGKERSFGGARFVKILYPLLIDGHKVYDTNSSLVGAIVIFDRGLKNITSFSNIDYTPLEESTYHGVDINTALAPNAISTMAQYNYVEIQKPEIVYRIQGSMYIPFLKFYGDAGELKMYKFAY